MGGQISNGRKEVRCKGDRWGKGGEKSQKPGKEKKKTRCVGWVGLKTQTHQPGWAREMSGQGQRARGRQGRHAWPASVCVLPYTVIGSCLIYFHLWQEPAAEVGAGATDEGHHSIAIHRAVAFDAAPQAGEDARRAAALAVSAVSTVAAAALTCPNRDEE